MKLLVKDRPSFDRSIDACFMPEQSIVLRYKNAFDYGMTPEEEVKYKDWLQKTSIREGSRIFHLINYQGVSIYILDETSMMHTRTLKSIDGCFSIANCKLRGYERIVFESGGNTGAAFTQYGQRAGLETFFLCPEENLSLLNSRTFESDKSHLISVEKREMVKKAAHMFAEMDGFRRIPETSWRLDASMFRGLFILEHMMRRIKFDWVIQSISAAFGPIGIYRVFKNFINEIGGLPKFLGVQQEANCPMYKAWKSNKETVEPVDSVSAGQLLTKVMYDVTPQTYGTYQDLYTLLNETKGELTTLNHDEFNSFLPGRIAGKNILELFCDNGVDITLKDGEIVEKTGLMALFGAMKAINTGIVSKGSSVLCCLTSGMSEADGKAMPEYNITDLEMTKDYLLSVSG